MNASDILSLAHNTGQHLPEYVVQRVPHALKQWYQDMTNALSRLGLAYVMTYTDDLDKYDKTEVIAIPVKKHYRYWCGNYHFFDLFGEWYGNEKCGNGIFFLIV